MNRPTKHTRIPDLPFISSLSGARIVDFHCEQPDGKQSDSKQSDFVLDYQAFIPAAAPEIGCEDGRLFERVRGVYAPRRIRFCGVKSLCCEGLYENLPAVPLEQEERILTGPVFFYPSGETHLLCILWSAGTLPASISLHAHGCVQEEPADTAGSVAGTPSNELAPLASEPITIVRRWSPPPILAAGLCPDLRRSREQFGGDPISIRLGARTFRQRLFVGGVEGWQSEHRPNVDAVLNLGEDASRWLASQGQHPADRWIVYGEGSRGMTVSELAAEANWVIERLRAGKRVLVHCSAGFNRSVSVCCAILILLEGLTAEAALARVRERHAWAHPDQNHWLALQWLGRNQ